MFVVQLNLENGLGLADRAVTYRRIPTSNMALGPVCLGVTNERRKKAMMTETFEMGYNILMPMLIRYCSTSTFYMPKVTKHNLFRYERTYYRKHESECENYFPRPCFANKKGFDPHRFPINQTIATRISRQISRHTIPKFQIAFSATRSACARVMCVISVPPPF